MISILTFFLSLQSSKSISVTEQRSSVHRSALKSTKIVWFRDHALRINDNEAFAVAAKETSSAATDTSIIPVYLWSTGSSNGAIVAKSGGTAKDVFVADAVQNLNSALGNALVIGSVKLDNEGITTTSMNVINELVEVCRRSDAKEVYYLKSNNENDHDLVAEQLILNGITPRAFGGSFSLIDYSTHDVPWKDIVLEHPWRSPLIPFVDYVKKVLKDEMRGDSVQRETIRAKDICQKIATGSNSDFDMVHIVSNPVKILDLVKTFGKTDGGTEWGTNIRSSWPASEENAKEALGNFIGSLESKCEGETKITHLASRLSPYLARGILSPRQVYDAIKEAENDAEIDSFIRRICWRDYTYAVAALYPDVTKGMAIRGGYEPLDNGIPLEGGDEEKGRRLNHWKKGQTGFPLVDAGMRQLAVEGWMPQKVRLVCSTFLVEGLGVSWREGMQHFAEFLVDYDDAINSNMWMNAGCVGLDPYYVGMNYKRRMYWDNDGSYIREWCPELTNLPDSIKIQLGQTTKTVDCLYEPWSSPSDILENADVVLGETYPERVCDDRESRSKFFREVREIRSRWPPSMTDDSKRDVVYMGEAGRLGLFTPRALQQKKPRF